MDSPDGRAVDDGWLSLLGVGIGYVLAAGLVFLVVFPLPYVIVSAL